MNYKIHMYLFIFIHMEKQYSCMEIGDSRMSIYIFI